MVTRQRAITALTLGLFAVGYGTNISTPFLVLYRTRLDLSDSATMAIFVVYVVGLTGALIVAGPLSDRYGRRPLCVPFIALSGVASLLLIGGRNSFALLLLGRLLLGMVSGAVLSVGSAWLLELMGRGNEMRAAIVTTVATYLGFGLGPLVSVILEPWVAAPLVTPFLIHVALVCVVMVLVIRVPETHPAPPVRRPLRIEFGVPPTARHEFLIVVLPAAIWVFAFPSASFALFPVILSEAVPGFDVAVAGASAALTAWAALVARPLLNRFGARAGLVLGMVAGTLGYVLGSVGFATDVWWLLLPAAVGLGAASGLIAAGSLTLLGRMATDESRGALTATFYLLAYPGMALPILLTSVAATTGMGPALAGVTVVAAASTAFVSVAVRRG